MTLHFSSSIYTFTRMRSSHTRDARMMSECIIKLIGPARLSYNLYFSVCFFSQNSVFLLQQISRNNVSVYFFSEANGAHLLI